MDTKTTAGDKYRCTLCNDIIQSMHRHHMAYCKCGMSFVDGGSVYVRASMTVEKVKETPKEPA